MSVTVILAEMEELAPTPKEVICADARKDGQAMIVTKIPPAPRRERLAMTYMDMEIGVVTVSPVTVTTAAKQS